MKRAVTVLFALACATPAEAQHDRERFALSLGGGIFGGHTLGRRSATFTENRAPSGARLTYFDAAGDVEQATLSQARLGLRVIGGLWLEAGALRGGRRMRTSVSDDFESAAPATLQADLDELQLEGALRYDVNAFSFRRGRGVPFLCATAGRLRQSPDGGGARLERTGRTYAAVVGLAYRIFSPSRGWLRAAGLRVDAGLAWRSGGFQLEDGRRAAPRATLAVYAAR